jgi:hypothetical protein
MRLVSTCSLVNAYKLEQKAKYPIIRVDQEILNRLKKDFINNSKGLLYDKILLYRQNQPESVFLNPYDIIENSTRSLEYLQSSLNDLFNSNNDGNDVFLSRLSKELLKNTNLIYEEFKSIFSPTKMMDFKLLILEKINFNMNKHQEFLSFQIFESTEYEQTLKVIEKLEGIKKLTEWSMGKIPSDTFKYYEYT